MTKNDVWECFGAFQKSLTCKKMQNLWFRINTQFQGTEVANTVSPQIHPSDSIVLKMMFESGLNHLQTFGM
jgi:hypothetical protein